MRLIAIGLLFLTATSAFFTASTLAQESEDASVSTETPVNIKETPVNIKVVKPPVAVDASRTPRLRKDFEQKLQERGPGEQNGEARQQELKKRRAERRKNIIRRLIRRARRILKRANRVLNRFNHIFARVQSRIDKFEKAGKDVSSLKPLVEAAESKKKAAAAALEKAKGMTPPAEEIENPKEAVHAFVAQMKEVRTALKEYRAAIVEIIRSIKGMSEGTKVTPATTSVPESTGTPEAE